MANDTADRAASLVYFIQRGEDGPIKIGFTRNLKRRLGDFAVSIPEPVHLRLAIRGSRDVERHYHATFAAHRIMGEWFKPSKEILDAIRCMAQEGLDASMRPGRREVRPAYLRAKKLAGGKVAWFWEIPSWARPPAERLGQKCPVGSEALGSDFSIAAKRAKCLNEQLREWRKRGRCFK
ncbi:GIY-YIG nuclease family protein [Sphingobium sp. CFD-2]|uniref:GIY-YIG nuclease family protein n=1 Tax=Sphingobium sp. CFD-2 TaxID=2878542 RepID=UPI0035A39A4A